jgi:hypothetical protein
VARPNAPSLSFPHCCPGCRRNDFERLGDVPGSHPPALFARCRNCGAWFKFWYPGQWEEVTGDEVENPTPGPQPWNRQFALRRVMLAIALVAVVFSIPAKMAWHARVEGRPFGVHEWFFYALLPILDFGLGYACWQIARSLTSGAQDLDWFVWPTVLLLLACIAILSIIIFVILFS